MSAPPPAVARQAPDRAGKPLRALEREAERIVREYDAQGDHRTGTKVDAASARWLAAQVRSRGVIAEFDPFELMRVDLRECSLEIGARRISGIPLFDRPFTGAEGVLGRLGRPGETCGIAIEDTFQSGLDGKVAGGATGQTGQQHRAVVRLTRGKRPGLTLANAPQFLDPAGVPCLQISGVHADWLQAEADAGAEARLTVHAVRRKSTAFNVVAMVSGQRPDLSPIVVSTPRSGWWNCASERGGGLVCWLEAMSRLQEQPPVRPVLFAAFSGHELGLLGGRQFLSRHADRAAAAHAWLHFGANVGAPGMPIKLQSGHAPMLDLARPVLQNTGIPLADPQLGGTPRGEAAVPAAAGIPYLAPISGSDVFHHPADRWPEAVDTALLARCADAFAQVARRMASEKNPLR